MNEQQKIEKDLHDKFYTDPSWKHIEEKLISYIEPLMDLSTVDMAQTAENVKVEIKGRMIAHETLLKFLSESGIIRKKIDKKTTFK